jgi:hypothetical protein
MIIESSRFHSRQYEKRNASGPIVDVKQVAEKYRGQPVLIWVGDGFLKFIREEVDPEQNRHMLEGILSCSLGRNLVLDPWFRKQDMEKIALESIINFVKGEEPESLTKLGYKERVIAASMFGLVIPASEISMMGRNPSTT